MRYIWVRSIHQEKIRTENRSDVEEYYRLKTKAIYAGYMFDIIEEKEDKISIVAMPGDYRDWLKLEMKCIDKGVYQKWVGRDEAELEMIKEPLQLKIIALKLEKRYYYNYRGEEGAGESGRKRGGLWRGQ